MKDPKHLRLAFMCLFLSLYHLFFWNEKAGINLFLFDLALAAATFWLNPMAFRFLPTWVTLSGVAWTGLMVVLNNSAAALVIHFLSFLAFLGYVHLPGLRSLWTAIRYILTQYLKAPFHLIFDLTTTILPFLNLSKPGRYLRLSLIPLAILTVFYFIFWLANPHFANLSDRLMISIGDWIALWFTDFNVRWFLFIVSGIFLLSGAIFATREQKWLDKDAQKTVTIYRKRIRARFSFSTLDLLKENRMGLLTLGLVNLLLLVVNLIDFNWIWLNFSPSPDLNLSQFVHEGTWLLILSILLSMGIMLYFFRGNLNFLSQNKWLKTGSYAWIAQNTFLTLSVGLRNYHYIDYHGLAYKRIGVIFFLALTLFGLISLALKIHQKQTFWHLLRVNVWAVFGIMMLISSFNWDPLIAGYNLKHTVDKEIDYAFLFSLSEKALPIIISEYKNQPQSSLLWKNTSNYNLEKAKIRLRQFEHRQKQFSWLSWNLADHSTQRFIDQNPDFLAKNHFQSESATISLNKTIP